MLTKKQPAAGEWWQYNKNYHCRVFILGANCSGHMVGVDRNGEYDVFDGRGNMALEFWHHEPLCDSFTWKPAAPIDPGEGWELLVKGTVLQDGDEVHTDGKWMRTCCVGSEVGDLSKGAACTYRRRKPVETWPKYYICGTWDHAAYVRTDSDGRITTICRDGSECRWDVETKLTAVLPDGWRSVTKAEALARVKAPAPVESIPAAVDHTPAPPVTAAIESPDDWVEITDTHPEHIRRKCDEVCTKEDDSETWIPVESSIGMPQSAWGFTRIRCRRRDLPPQPRLKRTDTFGRDVTEEYGLHDETDIVTYVCDYCYAQGHRGHMQK